MLFSGHYLENNNNNISTKQEENLKETNKHDYRMLSFEKEKL